ncbi:hypothetical protein [Anaeromyxobacter oryzisoli]|uniref:hypothetical protein n=1 Tax=Anaeromyxobacter oryzisoli TaxID=2925408 RepID=UPI001F5AA0D1|nr:hypothetical protein [Anaeromyxobacter sp. SG63]
MICSLCHAAMSALELDAGGDLGNVHTACFIAWDRRGEAAEALEVIPLRLAPEPLLVLGARPRYEKAIHNRVGEHVGGNVIVALEYQIRADGRVRRCWRMRCSCGREHLVETAHLDTRGARPCNACKARASAEREIARAQKVGGHTIAEIARLAGVPHQTIRQRIRLGWPIERLSMPARGGARRAA